eukprot:7342629-Prymnesium_polylepis.1
MLHANDDAVRGRHGMCGVLAVFWRCLYVVFFTVSEGAGFVKCCLSGAHESACSRSTIGAARTTLCMV